jgi:peptidoglycan/LPS O-acetylase OafA/YrhL
MMTYRADVDGLRAVAVILVVVFHAFPQALPGGFVGVDVFFVISGYLITGLILDDQAADKFSFRQFYARRARRILPALALIIAATLAIGWFVLLPAPFTRLGLHAIAGALFFPNLLSWSEAGYFDAAAKAKPLLHLWSLGVEEQFYLVWPALLTGLRWLNWRVWPPLLVVSGVSFVISATEAFSDPAAAFYSPLSRLWELGAGGLLASDGLALPFPQIASLAGLALIVAAAFGITGASSFPGLLALLPVGGAMLVLAGRSRILPMLATLGLISYPLYLWHWPLLSFLAILNGSNPGIETPVTVSLALVASLALAWATARFVENPIRFGSLRPRGAAISIAGLSFVAASAIPVFVTGGLPQRYAPVIRPVLAAMGYDARGTARAGRCWLAADTPFANYAPECRDGQVAVWGDSYSALLSEGLAKPFMQFNRDGCMPILADDAGSDQCGASNALIVDELLRLKPRRVILFSAWLHVEDWRADPRFVVPLEETLRRLRGGIDDVVLIGPSPYFPQTMPEQVFRFWKDNGTLPDRLPVPPEHYRATDRAMADAAATVGARFVSIFDALCDESGCLTHAPDEAAPLIWDQGHLTPGAARYLVRKLALDAQ